ncbi:GTPase HflX [Rhodohalobacter mucosus]|uniref:GTPase HflX n=1 Tax=Rhodohalobacter mucosus TaxID=2079485 RepID=A0A316TXH3_9BACT|nr:GTPase HflX [Rhodohalobacter mucosus]PWN08149.1 GTPase HflX [Rhodohalobacter mucosus]
MLEDLRKPTNTKERAVLVGIYGPDTPRWLASEYLEELDLLADTAGAATVDKILQNRPHPDPTTYVGKGKLNQLKSIASDKRADILIFDDDLSPTQVRNIEKTTGVKVLDRSGLILDIFASRAKTSAAKTQVELAQLQYLLPRLTRFWTHLSRQKGGIGTKGPGETQIETDRRLIGKRISVLKEKLEKLDRQRTTQRKGREEITRVALVGYTNAGKSTLMNTLTETSVLAEDRLFATLDSTVRRLELDNHELLLSDTVGFIRKLPHNLIESFKSTLDEVRESDVLLHVVDASSRMVDDYIDVVEGTLDELDANSEKKILVFNKIDLLEPEKLIELKKEYPGAVFVSAYRGIGLNRLLERLEGIIEEDYVEFAYNVPMSHYKAVAFLHDVAIISREHFEGNSVTIEGTISKTDRERFESMMADIELVKD